MVFDSSGGLKIYFEVPSKMRITRQDEGSIFKNTNRFICNNFSPFNVIPFPYI